MNFTLKEKMLSLITVMSMVVGMGMLAGCSSSDNPSGGGTAPGKNLLLNLPSEIQ